MSTENKSQKSKNSSKKLVSLLAGTLLVAATVYVGKKIFDLLDALDFQNIELS